MIHANLGPSTQSALGLIAALVLGACAGSDKDLGSTAGAVGVADDEAHKPKAKAPTETYTSPTSTPAATGSCEERSSFEVATASSFSLEQLYGVWSEEEVSVSSLGLPSGSNRVTLAVAEDEIQLVFGEALDESPLLDGTLKRSSAVREGFAYTLIPGEILKNEYPHPVVGVYPLAILLTVAPAEPYAELCSAMEPTVWSESLCAHTCMPEEFAEFSSIEESEDGMCLVDGTSELPCDDAKLCTSACYCDDTECHYDPLEQLQLVAGLREDAVLELFLPTEWTTANNAPTFGPNNQVVAQLEREH